LQFFVVSASTSNGFAPASRVRIARKTILLVSVRIDDHPFLGCALTCRSIVGHRRALKAVYWQLAAYGPTILFGTRRELRGAHRHGRAAVPGCALGVERDS
jgi:hypothetical protein